MKSQTVVVSVALLALCCLLVPRGGVSAGRIFSRPQTKGEKQARDELRDESQDDPESEQGLAVDPHPLGGSNKDRGGTEEAAQAGEWRKILLLTIKIQMRYTYTTPKLFNSFQRDMEEQTNSRQKHTTDPQPQQT